LAPETEEKKMLEQLVESKSNTKQARNRLGFLFTTFTLVTVLCFSAILSSLFAMNLAVGNGEFDLTALLAPVMPVETKPEPVQKKENQTEENATETVRQANMLRTDEPNIIPDTISVTPNTQKARPKGEFKFGKEDVDGSRQRGASISGNSDDDVNIGQGLKSNSSENNDAPELVKPVKKSAIIKSLGVINSQATYLPKPIYPAAAAAVRAGGAVNVQVMIDESGKVISAKAISGHTLLQGAAVNAARNARFTPTYLSEKAIKVTGVIIYNFVKN
jgi:TonB family protein